MTPNPDRERRTGDPTRAAQKRRWDNEHRYDTERSCSDCGSPIWRGNVSGYCARCSATRTITRVNRARG